MRHTRLFAACAMSMPTLALAHEGAHGGESLLAGLAHPLTGSDHLLALLAVGILAGRMGGRPLLRIPVAFLGMLAAGIAAGFAGVSLPLVETVILASVLVCALLALIPPRPLPQATIALAGFFALFHGHAHGVEVLAGVSRGQYALGLMVTSATVLIACAIAAHAPALSRASQKR